MSLNNFEELNHKQHALETTAIEAQMNAPTKVEAMHVSENAERAKDAADQAASVAKTLGSNLTGEPATAVDQLKTDASRTTEAAVSEGKRDVQEAKDIGVGYVEQAKSLANTALENAQNYLPVALGGKPVEPLSTSHEAPNLTDQVKNTAVNLYATVVSTAPTVKGAASAVTDAAQPHVESSKETAQYSSDAARSHIETATSVAKPHLENAKLSAQGAVDSALAGVEMGMAKVQIGADGPEHGQSKGTVSESPPTMKDIPANEGRPMQTRN